MTSSIPISISSVAPREIMPGFVGRFVHTENMTFAYWTIEKDAALPNHSHVHEQVVNLLGGTFELTVEGKAHVLETGDVFVIPRNAPHAGRALTDCRILDVFQPARDDYR